MRRRDLFRTAAVLLAVVLLGRSGSTPNSRPAAQSRPTFASGVARMPVHVVRFEYQHEIRWGVIRQGQITPLPATYASTGDLIRQVDSESLANLSGGEIPAAAVKLLSPVTRDQQFVCQGANYRQHMIESGMDPDAKHFNMIFTKAQSCIVPADSDLIKPRHVRFLDYEVELGLVLRREISGKVSVTDSNLHEFVAGVVVVNDYSARDIQIPQMQFYKGKSYRTFGPVGPYLCLLGKSEMHYLKDLQLRLTVNGEIRQSDSTANLVHGPAATLSELSGVHDFYPGDLIATGTPAGCALSIPSPGKQRIAALLPEKIKWQAFMKTQEGRSQYLKAGDVVEAKIYSSDGLINLGVQRNRVVEGV